MLDLVDGKYKMLNFTAKLPKLLTYSGFTPNQLLYFISYLPP